VTSAGAYGTRLTDIAMTIDPRTGDVIGKSARDVVITLDGYAEDADQVALIAQYRVMAEPLMNRPVGATTASFSRSGGGADGAGESVMGNLIADAMLEAAKKVEPGVQIAFMNPGGIRADLVRRDTGVVTFGDIFAIQPFGNDLVAITLTGAQIEQVLREQYQPSGNNILQVSEGFSFTWRQAQGQPIEIVPGSVKLNGAPLVADQPYRIVTNNFLVGGGDSFSGFKVSTKREILGSDITALEDYVVAHSPLAPAAKGRILRVE